MAFRLWMGFLYLESDFDRDTGEILMWEDAIETIAFDLYSDQIVPEKTAVSDCSWYLTSFLVILSFYRFCRNRTRFLDCVTILVTHAAVHLLCFHYNGVAGGNLICRINDSISQVG
jgi:hypothetical protein